VYAPRVALPGTDGAEHSLMSPRATVLVFFSSHCPCMRAHDARLVALANDYAARGVAFYAVDSEVNATTDTDAREAAARGYPFPILVDDQARVARALGADYATYSVVLDARGDVVYRGGLDSDHTHLSASPAAYLRDALDDVVAGHAVRRAKTEPLGCALRTW
jgi:peroxiredoxin